MSSIDDQIKEEIAANKILIYGKGTKAAPQCGFTVETRLPVIHQEPLLQRFLA